MKILLTLFTVIIATTSIAQSRVSKNELESVLKETLSKARNAVANAQNSWSYDNSNDDYFSKDTITLNTARSYRQDYCEEIQWSFYKNQKLILKTVHACTEPPTANASKEGDYIDLECVQKNGNLYLILKNVKGVCDSFRVLGLRKNEPIVTSESAFDYTLTLVRETSPR